ncbi:MAG: histidine phosphatase family protein [Acidobacteria bacterium]|nr:histidine phosphatase family protein [Acidobacteriota bacterium]MCA1627435.1 histidine phosphatase family protein [Acidobacteriota bacterium]
MEEIREPQTRTRTIVVFAMLFALLGAVVVFGYFSTFARPVTTVILVRHAEKKLEPNNQDPDLSPEGVERAQEIARVFGNAGINAIYATQYKRTQQTVRPLSDRTGVAATVLEASQPDELIKRIQTSLRGQTIFVAGHNNTVPAIASQLSGETFPVIPESEYDNLFIVTVYRFGKAKVVRLKYGKESTQGVGTGTMVPMNK